MRKPGYLIMCHLFFFCFFKNILGNVNSAIQVSYLVLSNQHTDGFFSVSFLALLLLVMMYSVWQIMFISPNPLIIALITMRLAGEQLSPSSTCNVWLHDWMTRFSVEHWNEFILVCSMMEIWIKYAFL